MFGMKNSGIDYLMIWRLYLRKYPYFLGSIILKQQLTTSDDSIGDRRIIIDGQQRLTTLNIFFKVLFLKIEQNQHFNQIFRLMLNKELAILHNHNDIDSFQKY